MLEQQDKGDNLEQDLILISEKSKAKQSQPKSLMNGKN